jgi:DUF1680 family protein
LSGFPESEFTALETQTLKNGNVPYYAIHKTLAGLLDVWRHIGDPKASDVMISLAHWVDQRTSRLSHSQMQSLISTEFGGMNDVLANLYHQTGDRRWLVVAQRFDHAAVFDPLASNIDKLNGLHANTQVPKWVGATSEYKATGNTRYRNIAHNAWSITVNSHTYAIGGNSQAEHFKFPNAIAAHLTQDTSEACNTYNMLKLTRELWMLQPDTKNTSYFDYYERALLNHLLGQQNQADAHGHVTYFTPLKPGGRRGVGPAWGGGTWSTDYDSFWCCQGTGLETNTKLMDSIYFHGTDNSTLFVNLFAPSVLRWTQHGVNITQTTAFPLSDTTTLHIGGSSQSSEWTMSVRIPSWTSNAEITVNGERPQNVAINPGTYALLSRQWSPGDTVTVRLPMKLRTLLANDKPNIMALAYGPVILAANYGNSTLSSIPLLALDSVRRSSSSSLSFTASSEGRTVDLGPFYDAHGFNYNVYWATTGKLRVAK